MRLVLAPQVNPMAASKPDGWTGHAGQLRYLLTLLVSIRACEETNRSAVRLEYVHAKMCDIRQGAV